MQRKKQQQQHAASNAFACGWQSGVDKTCVCPSSWFHGWLYEPVCSVIRCATCHFLVFASMTLNVIMASSLRILWTHHHMFTTPWPGVSCIQGLWSSTTVPLVISVTQSFPGMSLWGVAGCWDPNSLCALTDWTSHSPYRQGTHNVHIVTGTTMHKLCTYFSGS